MTARIKTIRIRRWNWCPWLKKEFYVPLIQENLALYEQDNSKLYAYDDMRLAQIALGLMQVRDDLDVIKQKLEATK
jgi:hypothetical protein